MNMVLTAPRPGAVSPSGLLLGIALASGCSVDDAPASASPPVTTETSIISTGDTLAVFPPPGSSLFLEGVVNLALAEDGASVYVLDRRGVHQLDLDGGLLASWGGEGEGPGELMAATQIQPAPGGGATVLDPQNRRLTTYGLDSLLMVHAESRHWMSLPIGDVLLAPALRLGTEPTKDEVLARFQGTSFEILVNNAAVPDAFVQDGYMGRYVGWLLVRLSLSEIIAVVSGSDLSAWRLEIGNGGRSIESFTELPVPADIREEISSAEAMEDAIAAPVSWARIAGGRLWLAGAGRNMPLAYSVPLDPAETMSWRLPNPNPELDLEDVVVLDDRVFLATATEVIVVEASFEP